jgi:PAS domain S-box-containing protein
MLEKKEIEKKLQIANENSEDLEAYIREFSAFLPLAVCTINPLGRIVNINKAAESLTGYPSFELVGEFILIIFSEKKEIEKITKSIVRLESIPNKELTLITKQGKEILVGASISIRKDAQNNYIGYFIAFSDISEIKTLQENLEKKVQQRTEELRERVDELEQFRQATIGREMRIIELKEKIKELENQLKKQVA